MTPNPSLNPRLATAGLVKPGLRQSYYHRSRGLQALPLLAGLARKLNPNRLYFRVRRRPRAFDSEAWMKRSEIRALANQVSDSPPQPGMGQ